MDVLGGAFRTRDDDAKSVENSVSSNRARAQSRRRQSELHSDPIISMQSHSPVSAFQALVTNNIHQKKEKKAKRTGGTRSQARSISSFDFSFNPFCCWKHEDFESPSSEREFYQANQFVQKLGPKKRKVCNPRLDVSRSRPREGTPDAKLVKRKPEISSGYDPEVSRALEREPKYIKLQEQVLTQIYQKNLHRDADLQALWNEQVLYSQDTLREKLILQFGRNRTAAYIRNLEALWESKEKIEIEDDSFANQFFHYFDAFHEKEITLEMFFVIFDIIDKELSQEESLAEKIFVFLDTSNRGTFNQHDLMTFFNKEWGGSVGRFQRSARKYFENPTETEFETRNTIRHYLQETPLADLPHQYSMNSAQMMEEAAVKETFAYYIA